jgi:purine-nucleoside phosphorylase
VSEAALERLRGWRAEIGIVLGSGLSPLVPESTESIAYSDFPELPKPSVPGHAGRFVLGTIGHIRVIFAQGRVHLYEGHAARQITAGIRTMAAAGVKRLILTNAAGLANESFSPGSWMMITDQLNLTGTSPLLGSAEFVDMTEIYSKNWRADFARAAKAENIVLYEGVYAGCLGPQYETPAEVRMLRRAGADAIGMSTVLEAIQARALGLEVAGFSCLTNWAAGIGDGHLSHAEVLAAGREAAQEFIALLEAALQGRISIGVPSGTAR